MKRPMYPSMKKTFWLLAVAFFFLAARIQTVECLAQTGGHSGPNGNGTNGQIEFNFQNVDINVFIKFISELTGKNFIVDERVKGEVSIISPAKISVEEAYEVFESVLEVHGFTSVKSGGVIKIVPAPDAKTKSVKTLISQEALEPSDQVVTQVIPLKYANAEEIKQLFTPLVSKNSVILAYPRTNTVIVTDIYSNIRRLMQILGALDVVGIGEELSVIPLKYASASEMENLLKTVFRPRKGSKAEIEEIIRFRADERTNSIVLMASEDEAAQIKKLIALLDSDTPRGTGKIHVYYLENAVAEDLAPILQELPGKHGAPGEPGGPVVSKNVRVSADKATNSLIIMAENDEYAVLEDIVRQLDIPRAMVYIESLIMEVNVNKNFNLGIDWSVVGKTTIDGKDSIIGGGYSGTGGLNPLDLLNPEGFSMGVVGGGIEIATELGTIVFPSIGAVAKAFREDEDVKILSTPQILTTDNEEAKIHVGRNIPYQTQSSTTDNTVYNSFEYRDVGMTLTLRPHISKDRLVRLEILQELTSIPGDANNPNDRPTTLKRSINTTVIVKDRGTVVLGGLIDDTIAMAENSIPCLGDIPGLSWLFKTIYSNTQRTNLFVFLTPYVIQTTEEADNIYNRKKVHMEQIEGGVIKMYEKP